MTSLETVYKRGDKDMFLAQSKTESFCVEGISVQYLASYLTSLMKSLLFVAMVLCVWCVAQVQTQDNTDTLRLCGRAFVRAVVYTCGGSRWRRLMENEEAVPDG